MTQLNAREFAIRFIAVVLALVSGNQSAWCQAEKELRGLPNFGKVTENLYRGAQPTPDGFNVLHAMNVGMVINFRDEQVEATEEQQRVESLGMKYVKIPWDADHEPSSAQVVEFLNMVRTNPNTKIFVHCRRGADRTGVMVAAYRVAVEQRPVSEAVSEMRRYHYDWLFLPHLRRYVESLPGLLQQDPQFADYRPQTSSAK
jgi:tyrosine-protein phosphatase SIW14